MGYLDNTQVIVDAVLTKRGRELLARNDGSFRVTQFALADDEIDYSLYNEFHPNGSQFSGEAIENMPITEAIPDETSNQKTIDDVVKGNEEGGGEPAGSQTDGAGGAEGGASESAGGNTGGEEAESKKTAQIPTPKTSGA